VYFGVLVLLWRKRRKLSNSKTEMMNKYINLAITFCVLFTLASCCNCSNEEQTFASDDLEWIPDGDIGDSVVFINADGEEKIFYIRVMEQYISEVKCAGPCFCNCPEENTGYYDFQFTGEEIPNTLGIREGITINLIKTNNMVQKTFTWSCPYGSFQDFDYSIDTITVRNKLYHNVFVKEMDVCNIRKIFYCKGIGLIRFDYDDGTWELNGGTR